MLLVILFALVLLAGVSGQGDGSPAFELKGRFIQVTDMHPDKFYLDGSLARTACHRMAKDDNSTASKPPKHKYNRTHPPDLDAFGSDFDESDNRTAGHFAVPDGPCDSPWSLINATFEYIDKVWKDQIDFIVWTGDNVRHDNDNHFPRSPSHIYESNRIIRDKFYNILKPENPLYPLTIPVIPSYGNNDVWPHNIFAPGPNYQTRSYASLWSDMIPEYEMHTFERGGYFATEVLPNKLAVVSLNTLYWFESNAAVDGCDFKSEPGSQQFEWLRVQLTEYRKRGVKAYLTGHVPPGRKFYYPSCFRRYALWSHSFRDVILGHFYGHNNMDHFFFLDAKQALEEEEEAEMLKSLLYSDPKPEISSFNTSDLAILARLSQKSADELLDSHDEIRVMGAEEYMTDLKEMFEKLPAPPKAKKWKGSKGKKQRRRWEREVREYEENYQVVHVAPSIIPSYFSGLRVFEYNVSELASQQFTREVPGVERTNWTEFWIRMDTEIAEEEGNTKSRRFRNGLSFQNPDITTEDILSDPTDPTHSTFDEYRDDYVINKKEPKKPPPIHLPQGPHKSSPRGPFYVPQLFTPVRWEVHFANLTEVNLKYDKNPKKTWDYSKDFFKLEYASDAAPYYMRDMTMATWLELGRKIGKEKEVKKTKRVTLDIKQEELDFEDREDWRDNLSDSESSDSESGEDITKDEKGGKEKKKKGGKGKGKSKETFWDVFLRRAFINSGHHLQLDFDRD